MTTRTVDRITGHSRIDGVVPGVRGQRALPVHGLGIVDPFVMLDHIGPQEMPDDFHVDGHPHPHRGFETLTMMFEGVMEHVDSAGNRETLRSGTTQNMVAGRGIQHGGDMAADPESGRFHEVQLWVNMPAASKMVEPSIATAHAGDTPVLDRGTHTLEVITGTVDGATSPLTTTQPTTVARVRASAPGPVRIDDLDPDWNVLVYVLEGRALAGGQPVETHQSVLFAHDGDAVEVTADEPGTDLLVLAGRPIGEPVVLGGPFVMNTEAEIAQAEADFAAGLFGEVDAARA